jgi:DNA-3-methyladenine glycosylase
LTHSAYRADDPPSEHTNQEPPSLLRLRRDDVSGPSVDVARWLLGRFIVRHVDADRSVVRIAETEAYDGPRDRASHARAGRTARTSVMFGPAGHAYVYLVYGMHHCLNVVCGSDGDAAAVLIRAVEPVAGIANMRTRRGPSGGSDERLGAGPARACQALGIDRNLGGIDMISDQRLWLASDGSASLSPGEILSGPRIGVDYAGPDWASRPWRFGIADSVALSKPFTDAA